MPTPQAIKHRMQNGAKDTRVLNRKIDTHFFCQLYSARGQNVPEITN